MHIRELRLAHFTNHEDTTVILPERGLVVIQGKNGSGKSSLIEAVAQAFWGKSLRDEEPWQLLVAGSVQVQSDAVVATRKANKAGAKSLEWHPVAAQLLAAPTYETTGKAQKALEAYVGELATWRKTHVFSSQDADLFTRATDMERKALIERLLGLEVFDEAQEAAKSVVAALLVEYKQVDLTANAAALAEKLAHQAFQLERDRPLPLCPVQPIAQLAVDWAAEVARLGAEIRALDETRRAMSAEAQSHHMRLHGQQVALHLDQSSLRGRGRLGLAGHCPTCGQGTDCIDLGAIQDELLSLEKQLAELSQQEREMQRAAQINDLGARDAQQVLRNGLDAATAQLRAQDRLKVEHESYQRAMQSYQLQLKSRDQEVAKRQHRHAEASLDMLTRMEERSVLARKVTHVEIVAGVLGGKGVRAHVLGEALAGIEAVANGWLERVAGPGVSLQLSPYTERKSGAVSDSISIKVTGVGGGRGYKAASGGERRRIDAALLLALAEVSSAAAGQAPGTLWMDEVFDALDEEGVDAVSDVLAELAEERAVVLITHSSVLASRVPAALRLRAQDGRLTAF